MPVYDFAVYSSDDGSLTLYHRRRILLPLKDMVFEGKRVSACFRIDREGRDHGWTADSKCKKAMSVLVADAGIKPKKIDYWLISRTFGLPISQNSTPLTSNMPADSFAAASTWRRS